MISLLIRYIKLKFLLFRPCAKQYIYDIIISKDNKFYIYQILVKEETGDYLIKLTDIL